MTLLKAGCYSDLVDGLSENDRERIDFEIKFYEDLIRGKPDYVDALRPLADAYTRGGSFRKGLEIDQRLAKLCPDDQTVFYNLACSYCLVGDIDSALSALGRAIQLGYADRDHLRRDPDLAALRRDPRFHGVLKSLIHRPDSA